jgi:WD40 repeat protein
VSYRDNGEIATELKCIRDCFFYSRNLHLHFVGAAISVVVSAGSRTAAENRSNAFVNGMPMVRLGAIVERRRGPSARLGETASSRHCHGVLLKAAAVIRLKRNLLGLIIAALATAWSAPRSFAEIVQSTPPSGAQTSLPSLRLARTLSVPNEVTTFGLLRSGNAHLTMSPDGERLAAYVHFGVRIMLWSPDSKHVWAINRYNNAGLQASILAFVSGHDELVTSPAAETDSSEDRDKVDHVAFSVLNAETGKVIRNIDGPNPVDGMPENAAYLLAVSPDQNLVAVAYGQRDPLIGIYTTGEWRLVATIHTPPGLHEHPHWIAFSPDGKLFAVLRGRKGGVEFYNVGGWNLSSKLEAFDDASLKDGPLLDGLVFSPDGKMVAIASSDGGLWWLDSDRTPTRPGIGIPRQELPADPLRVLDINSGRRISSLESFPGVKGHHGLSWSPLGGFIAFLDGMGDIRLWDPTHPGASVEAVRMGVNSTTLIFSSDGSALFADSPDGISVFEIVPQKSEKVK